MNTSCTSFICAWTIASETDLTTLINNYQANPVYTQEGSTWGFKFTGKANGYTDNSIFLTSGVNSESRGNAGYWSSTEPGSGEARFVRLSYNGDFYSSWGSSNRTSTYFVRLVLR